MLSIKFIFNEGEGRIKSDAELQFSQSLNFIIKRNVLETEFNQIQKVISLNVFFFATRPI